MANIKMDHNVNKFRAIARKQDGLSDINEKKKNADQFRNMTEDEKMGQILEAVKNMKHITTIEQMADKIKCDPEDIYDFRNKTGILANANYAEQFLKAVNNKSNFRRAEFGLPEMRAETEFGNKKDIIYYFTDDERIMMQDLGLPEKIYETEQDYVTTAKYHGTEERKRWSNMKIYEKNECALAVFMQYYWTMSKYGLKTSNGQKSELTKAEKISAEDKKNKIKMLANICTGYMKMEDINIEMIKKNQDMALMMNKMLDNYSKETDMDGFNFERLRVIIIKMIEIRNNM